MLRFPASVPAGNAHVRSDGQTETVAQGFVFVWQVNLLNEPLRFLHTQTHPDYARFIQVCTHTIWITAIRHKVTCGQLCGISHTRHRAHGVSRMTQKCKFEQTNQASKSHQVKETLTRYTTTPGGAYTNKLPLSKITLKSTHTHTALIDFTTGSGGGQQSSGEVLHYCCCFFESF